MAKCGKLPESVNIQIDETLFNQNVLDHLMKIYNYEAWYGGQSSGKCLKRGTKVVMYSGELKCVEDVKISDLLMGIDSTPRKVIGLSYGADEMYTVHQCHGMDYTVNSQHILSLKKAKSCRKTARSKERYPSYGAYVDMPIQEYMKQSDRWKGRFYGYRVAVEFSHKPVVVDPYFLGTWLADGTACRIEITTPDKEVKNYWIDYAKQFGQEVVYAQVKGDAETLMIPGCHFCHDEYQNQIRKAFQDMNLIDNKHIPDIYLYNGREIRMEILAGILDGDGCMQGNCYDIVQKDKKFSEQIQYLCHSLGLRCSMQECQKECCNNGVWGTYYRMCISGDTQLIPVKVERRKIKSFNKTRDTDVSGLSIESAGWGEYFGFTLDGDHKFLLEDFTVTHNSWGICQRKLLHLTLLPMRNMMCLRTQSTDCFDSCWGQMLTAMEQLKLNEFWEVRRSDHRLTNRINGNSIYFDGVDKIENIKSFKPEKGNLTDVWYEEATEEPQKATLLTIDGRLRDEFQKCSLIVSFNPTYRTHWLREWIFNDLKGKDALIVQSTYRDNKFCSKELIQKTEALKYTDPYRYQVYGLGEWGVTGRTVFNSNKIQQRLTALEEVHRLNPPVRIEFAFQRAENGLPDKDSFAHFKHPDGETWVYEAPNPKHPYVLSIDTAGEGIDFFAGQVMDNINGKQVATFHSERDPDVCVLQLFGLAKYYNSALVVPEINFDGSYLLNKFKELRYNNIYQRTKSADSYSEGYQQKLGFRTTTENRSRMLVELKDWSEEHMNCINDVATLGEMLTFTLQAKRLNGTMWAAEAGAHDDLIMSLAIALQGREQQRCEEIPEHRPLKGELYPEELEMRLKSGEISASDVFEYKKKHSFFGEKYKVKKVKGNRYAR